MANDFDAVVAGHICLDIIPTLRPRDGGPRAFFQPGALIDVGEAAVSTGGAVSNTGVALHQLGVRTRLMGLVGRDLFGNAVRDVLGRTDPQLARGLLTSTTADTSYTVVLNPPNLDRMFLHCPGANDSFRAADIPYDELAGSLLFHFGYPPLMRRFFRDGGRELAAMFGEVESRGVVTSLDMAYPDPASEAGRADWPSILERALPHVDLFLPSIEETLFMLDRAKFDHLAARGDIITQIKPQLLAELGDRLIALGVAVVGLKLGEHGLYVRTSGDARRMARVSAVVGANADTWLNRELYSPCFRVNVVGTTGCGDSTIAGFLAALLAGDRLDDALTTAVGVGAYTAEAPDATSGVPSLAMLRNRLNADWQKRPAPDWPEWTYDAASSVAAGPLNQR